MKEAPKSEFSGSIEETILVIEENPEQWLRDLESVDELDSVVHDLLIGGRLDLALPFYMKMREDFDSLLQRSLRLYELTGS